MEFTVFVLLAIFFWGIAPIWAKIGLVKVDPFAGLAIRSFVIGAILLAICFLTGKFTTIAQVSLRDALFIGADGICASLLGHYAYYSALKLGDVSRVAPLLASYPAVTMIIALLFLGEQLTWNKALGVAVIIAGVAILKL